MVVMLYVLHNILVSVNVNKKFTIAHLKHFMPNNVLWFQRNITFIYIGKEKEI